MAKKLKKIPNFKNEHEEAKFWNTHNSTDYIDWSKAQNVIFPNLKPTSRSISIRIPDQALMKQYIAQGVAKK